MAMEIILMTSLIALGSAHSAHATPTPSPTSTTDYSELKTEFYSDMYQFPNGTINSTLAYLESTGVIEEFFQLPNATLLFPKDSAYESLPSNVTRLLSGSDGTYILANVLRYHIIPFYYTAEEALNIAYKTEVPNQLGAPLYGVNVGSSISFIPSLNNLTTNVTVSDPDAFDDGTSHVVHLIPEVLLPSNLSVLLPTPAPVPSPVPPPAPAPASAPTLEDEDNGSSPPSKSGSGTVPLNVFLVLGSLAVAIRIAL